MGCMSVVQVFPLQQSGRRRRMPESGPDHAHLQAMKGLSLEELNKVIRIPLTEREVFSITKSWKQISRNMTHTGIAMFLK